MNREIKFRGKDTFKSQFFPQRWLYGTPVQDGDETWMCVKKEDKGIVSIKVDPSTIGQYTGLRDRRGQEVYEGDVVFWIGSDMRGRGRGEQGAIIWDKHTMSWAILRDKPTSDGRPCIISRPFDKKHLEVVGNIHDNPDLIRQEVYDKFSF